MSHHLTLQQVFASPAHRVARPPVRPPEDNAINSFHQRLALRVAYAKVVLVAGSKLVQVLLLNLVHRIS